MPTPERRLLLDERALARTLQRMASDILHDTTQADRQWVTSLGSTVWISYHDSGSSTLIHLQRSTDDGKTWTKVGDPIVGQGATTGDST